MRRPPSCRRAGSGQGTLPEIRAIDRRILVHPERADRISGSLRPCNAPLTSRILRVPRGMRILV
jgi:hypothetical protein